MNILIPAKFVSCDTLPVSDRRFPIASEKSSPKQLTTVQALSPVPGDSLLSTMEVAR